MTTDNKTDIAKYINLSFDNGDANSLIRIISKRLGLGDDDKENYNELYFYLNNFPEKSLEIINNFFLKEGSKNYSNLKKELTNTLGKVKKNDNDKYTAEEEKEALEIIYKGNAFNYCLDVISEMHVGEREIIKLLLLSGISPGMYDREKLIHCMGVGSSGKGKTDAMIKVGNVFSNIERLVSSSPMALFYKAKNNEMIDKGIIFSPENDVKNEFMMALERVLTDKDSENPYHETVIKQEYEKLEINQKNVFWRNSVGTSEDEDNQLNNRYFIFNVEESKEQDHLVYEHILSNINDRREKKERNINIAKAITDKIKSEPYKILIPFSRWVDSTNKQDRRQLSKFLNLIYASAYFNRFNRYWNEELILADLRDFNLAKEIWGKIKETESTKLSKHEGQILKILSSKNDGLSISDVASLMDVSDSTISRKLKNLEEKGSILSERHSESITYGDGKRKTINYQVFFASNSQEVDFMINTEISDYEGLVKEELPKGNIENLYYPRIYETTGDDPIKDYMKELMQMLEETKNGQ